MKQKNITSPALGGQKMGIPTKATIRCHCGSPVILRRSVGIYSRESEAEPLYVCARYPECDSYARVHPGTNEPMSTLADSDLRYLRKMAHHYFNQIYVSGIMNKSKAYTWLSITLGLPIHLAHIGYLQDDQCERVISESRKLLELMGVKPTDKYIRVYGGGLNGSDRSSKRAG